MSINKKSKINDNQNHKEFITNNLAVNLFLSGGFIAAAGVAAAKVKRRLAPAFVLTARQFFEAKQDRYGPKIAHEIQIFQPFTYPSKGPVTPEILKEAEDWLTKFGIKLIDHHGLAGSELKELKPFRMNALQFRYYLEKIAGPIIQKTEELYPKSMQSVRLSTYGLGWNAKYYGTASIGNREGPLILLARNRIIHSFPELRNFFAHELTHSICISNKDLYYNKASDFFAANIRRADVYKYGSNIFHNITQSLQGKKSPGYGESNFLYIMENRDSFFGSELAERALFEPFAEIGGLLLNNRRGWWRTSLDDVHINWFEGFMKAVSKARQAL